MADQISTIGILVKDFSKASQINSVLHAYSDNILSRSGMPYREKNVRLIHVVLESSPEIVNALNQNLSAIDGVSSKIMTFEL